MHPRTWRSIRRARFRSFGVLGRSAGAEGLLTEATAILNYLARSFPKVRLLPQHAAAEARSLEWFT